MAPIVQIIERYLCLVVSAASTWLQVVGDSFYFQLSMENEGILQYGIRCLDVYVCIFCVCACAYVKSNSWYFVNWLSTFRLENNEVVEQHAVQSVCSICHAATKSLGNFVYH